MFTKISKRGQLDPLLKSLITKAEVVLQIPGIDDPLFSEQSSEKSTPINSVQTETQFNPAFQIVAIAEGDKLGTIPCYCHPSKFI